MMAQDYVSVVKQQAGTEFKHTKENILKAK